MLDYAALANTLQERLAAKLVAAPELLNRPGLSLLFKVDPLYAAALWPNFPRHLAAWSAAPQDRVEQTLLKTGALVSKRAPDGQRRYALPLRVAWSHGGSLRRATLPLALLQADFLDRALALYARAPAAPLGELRFDARERPRLDEFLEGKTPLRGLAFAE